MLSWFKKDDDGKKGKAQRNHPMADTALEYLEVKADDVILQVGLGGHLEVLVKLVPLLPQGRMAAVDGNPAEVSKALRRFEEEFSHFRADFRDATVSKLPFYDGSFTKVLCLDQLQSWISLDKGLDEIQRVLAPGGIFVLVWSLPLEGEPGPAAKRPPDLDAMNHLLKAAGFYHPVHREHREGSLQYYQIASRKP